jgi:cell division protease FtsH
MNLGKNFLIWIGILVVLVTVFELVQGGARGSKELPFSEFMQQVDQGGVQEVTIRGPYIEAVNTNGASVSTYSPGYPELVSELRDKNVKINAAPVETAMSSFFGVLLGWFPVLLLVGVWVFFMRQMQGGGKGGAMGFGRSRARLMTDKVSKVTFDDVAGIQEAKEELEEIVEFLKNPMKFQKLGGKIPKGCLLVGPPGTGKTLLARAIAGEAKVPFFSISGSDFVEMFVGVGASRVRDMFEQGKKNAPCLIFIDEIDAVGRHRGAGVGGGNDEREQTLNQMLVEMDGFEGNDGVIILAATNRPDVLDPALLRPGRFDRQIVVPVPDVGGRERIIEVHLRKVPMGPDVDVRTLARGTPGFAGADLANLVNEAALLAARRDKKVVTMKELEDAKDKVMMGAERRSMVMTQEEKELTAYHEAGHAVVSIHCPASDPIHKATIIPRGRALGLVMRLPERDRLSITREKKHADLMVAMGGRVAEELIFGYNKVTTGASSDIRQATRMARAMATEWGMSDKIGPLFHSSDNEEVFLGHAVSKQKNMSDTTAALIDEEVKRFVEDAYQAAKKVLNENRNQLETLAQGLLTYETLSGEEIKDLLAGKKINKEDTGAIPKRPTRAGSVPSSISKLSSSSDKKADASKPKKAVKSSSKSKQKTEDKDA